MSHLKIYAGPDHPHHAQKPIPWTGPETLLKQRQAAKNDESAKSDESAESAEE
jgi:hypothetical protein